MRNDGSYLGGPQDAATVSASEKIADYVCWRLHEGSLIPGQRLIQRDLAEEFGVSTTPVREAFHKLAAQGLVEIDQYRGATVASRSPEEIREIYEIRKSLEGLAAVKAMGKLGPQDYQALRRLDDRMRAAQDGALRAELNHDFHRQLYDAAQMPRLTEMVIQLRHTVTYYIDAAYRGPASTALALDDHEEILVACESGDPLAVRRAVEEHLEHTARAAIESAERLRWLAPVQLREQAGRRPPRH